MRTVAFALAAVTGLSVAVVVAPTAGAAAPAVPPHVAVAELDLSGVRSDLVASLPTAPPAPADAPADAPTSAPDTFRALTAAPPDPAVLTAPLDTAPFSVLGFTWDRRGSDQTVVRYRTRSAGTWSSWAAVEASDQVPDGEPADGGRAASDPVVAMHSDGLQVWAQDGAAPVTHLKVVLVDPGADPAPAAAAEPAAEPAVEPAVEPAAGPAAAAAAVSVPAQPAIVTRAQWGADESLRTCTPDWSTSMVSAAVHHTASTNDYAPADVPGILRGFLAYHTRPVAQGGRGWCDIGYNFLVDRFGRVFEGRARSIDTTVIGVHTGGFNSRTVGVAAIGTFTDAAPPPALLESLSRVIAWKFSQLGVSAGASITMTSGGGASKYPAGTTVTFPTIYGHRDAQLTSCPGQLLYDSLPAIRTRVAQLSNASVAVSPRGHIDQLDGRPTSIAVSGWALDPQTTASLGVDVSVDGVVTRLTAAGSRPDVATAYPANGALHGFSATIPAALGSHLVCVTALNVGDGRDILLGCSLVTVANHAPIGSLDLVRATSDGVRVAGWALDPDTDASISVHVYVDSVGTALTAALPRADVAARYGLGAAHGFDATIPARQGSHRVCAYAINTPAGTNRLLRCTTVQVGHPPTGAVDRAVGGTTTLTVAGWALDPDTTASIMVHVYVDGVLAVAAPAAGARPDVARAFGLGAAHGYSVTTAAATGTHRVCVYGIDSSGGTNTALGCRSVVVTNRPPIGVVDTAVAAGSQIAVTGWALDPDTQSPIRVHVYVDGAIAGVVLADRSRPDVGRVLGDGDLHGYSTTVPVAAGAHQLCVYAIDSSGGANTFLSCRSVTTT